MSGAETRNGVCNLCEAICGVTFTLENGAVTSVRGNPDDPLSRGHICPKAFAMYDVYADPDRLRRPVRRVSAAEDEWVEISWDEALDEVAAGLARAVNEHGRDALAIYLGNPNVHSLGALTHGPPLVRSFGTRNVYSATSVDQLPHQLIAMEMYGHQALLPVPDIDRTDLFVLFGGNPIASNGSMMTVPDFPRRLRDLKARGGRFVVVDPRRTESAKVATDHHFVRPGTDAGVLLAMLHTVFAERLATPPPYAAGVADVERAVADFTPEWAAALSGLDAEAIRQLARDLATTKRAALHGRVGVSTQEFGSVCQWAIQCLNLLTGHLDWQGGVMFTSPAIDAVGRGLIGRGHRGVWRSRVRGLPEFAGELPVSTLVDEILTPGDGQVHAVLTLAGNPVSSTPDGKRLGEALERVDFMAAVDFYVNETTRYADVILPPTHSLERDHYDLAFHLLAVRDTARFTPALFDRPDDALDDWEIYREVALRATRLLNRKRSRRRRLFLEARLRLSPTRTVDLLLRTGRHRLSVSKLLKDPNHSVDLGPLRPGLPGKLQTEDRLVHAAPPEYVVDAITRLRQSPEPDPDQLLLIGRRHQRDNNSWMHNAPRLTRGKARHQLLMHPADLAERGIDDGATVQVASRVGKVEVEVAASEDMMRGVVSLPHGYGHRQPGVRLENATMLRGVSVNDLTDPARTDVSGNAVLNGVPVSVTPCA